MSHSYPLKNLPTPMQFLIRPMLLISLGLHSLLLLVPISAGNHPVLDKEEEAVKITQLPAASKESGDRSVPKAPPKQASSNKASQPSRQASSSSRPRTVATPGPQRTETSQSSRSATGQVDRSSETGDQAEGETGDQTKNPFADFPHYPGAKPGYSGKQSIRQTEDGLDQMVAHFKEQLPARKYKASSVTDEPDKKVYRVFKGDMAQYLSLFTVPEGTVYVLSPQPVNLDELNKAVEVPPELYIALSQLSASEAQDTDFDDPDNFYIKYGSEDERGSVLLPELRSGIDGSPKMVGGQTPSQVSNNLQPKLEGSGFKVSETKPYGGGALYKVQKGSFTGYVNLVPTKNRQGTNVVVWTRSPR